MSLRPDITDLEFHIVRQLALDGEVVLGRILAAHVRLKLSEQCVWSEHCPVCWLSACRIQDAVDAAQLTQAEWIGISEAPALVLKGSVKHSLSGPGRGLHLSQSIRPESAGRRQRHPESDTRTANRLGNVPTKHIVRTISAAHAQPVFGPIQPHHPAPVDERYETRGRLCRVARTSAFGHARYQLRKSPDLSGY